MTHDPLFHTPVETTNVVSLKMPAHTGDFAASRDLHAYWDALRGNVIVPARADFDPRGIERSLPSTFVAERVAPSVARIRVAGSVLNDALGMDVRGMPITAFFEPMSRETLADATRALFASPSMVALDLSARRGFARKPVRGRMLLLPLSDTTGDITRLVGCLDLGSERGTVPRRFKIEALRSAELTGEAPRPCAPRIPFAGARNAPEPAPNYAFAESPVTFRSPRRSEIFPTPQPSGLRLVVDNS